MKITVATASSSPRPSGAPRPTALSEVCELLGGDRFPLCESRSLRLEKFVRIGGTSKREEIDAVVKCRSERARPMPKPAGAIQFPATLKGRLIVNQAGGILENAGLCLHPHFGYPYVPGSAVKGVARHAAWCEWNAEADDAKKADIARRIAVVFGYPTMDKGLDEYLADRGCDERRSGAVTFFAAEPENGKAPLVTDIVNCHHRKYYDGSQPDATDDEQPNPQFFPAVEAGATFVFTIAPVSRAKFGGVASPLPNGASSATPAGRDVPAALADAKRWLKAALTENGVGAKTSAGYGWFECEDFSDVQPDKDLLNQWSEKYPSATKQRKVFFVDEKLNEIASRSAVFKRTVLEFYLQAEWWEKEKKNSGSKITSLVTNLASKFGMEGRLS